MIKLWIFITVIMLASSCATQTVESDLVHSIPDHSKVVIAFENLEDLASLIKDHPVYNELDELSRIQELEQTAAFLENYKINRTSFLALSMEGKNQSVLTLITNSAKNLLDSVDIQRKETYNEVDIYERLSGNQTFYTADHKGSHIASSSILVVESLIRRNLEDYVFDPSFVDLFEKTHQDLSIYIKASDGDWLHQYLLGRNKTNSKDFADWYQLEPNDDGKTVQLDGLITYSDSSKQHHMLYDGLKPTANTVDGIAPAIFKELSSTTYTNAEQLIDNIAKVQLSKPSIPPLLRDILENSQEISKIEVEDGTAIAFTLLPYEELFVDLDSLSSSKRVFRDQDIYGLQNSIATRSLYPLIEDQRYHQAAIIGNYLLITSNDKVMEQIIASHQSDATLSFQNWWKEARKELSDSSTLLKVNSIDSYTNPNGKQPKDQQKALDAIGNGKVKNIISQYVHEEGYAFYHMQVPYQVPLQDQSIVAQVGSYRPDGNIVSGPYLFPNHTNGTFDVALQTEDHQLTLISETGKVHWSKQLDSKILGPVQYIDIYANGRKQLVFSTMNDVYLLDRNGKDVNKFPYHSNKDITLPLSIFDYDQNNKLRLLLTQGSELTMLDVQGNVVNGFNYQPSDLIESTPIHFKNGKKDFIAFTTSNGQIKLLNRTGKIRTKVKEKVDIQTSLFQNNGKLLFLNSNAKLLELDPLTGTLETPGQKMASENVISINDNVWLSQYDNTITINGKKTTLPYGTYLTAQLVKVDGKDYVATVDQGGNKVYVLNSKGDVLPFFPIYGNGQIDIKSDNSRYLTTMDNNTVLIYRW